MPKNNNKRPQPEDTQPHSAKRQKSDHADDASTELGSPISWVDIKKIEYAARLLQKNIKIVVSECPDVLELDSADTALKTELDHNALIQLAARLNTKYKIGKLSLFDKIMAGKVEVSDKDRSRLLKARGSPPVATIKATEEKLAPITNDIGSCGVSGKMPPLPCIKDRYLYERVFVHKSTINLKSYYNENEMRNIHNERLEFLGDSVLNNLVTIIIYTRFPNASEGDLSQIRSHLIDNKTLAQFLYDYGLNRKLRTNMSEEDRKACGQKIDADIFEAYVGALAIERGMDLAEVKEWLVQLYEPKISRYETDMNDVPLNKDAKSELYLILGSARFHPTYHVVQRGDGIDNMYLMECRMGDEVLGRGTASGQRDAGLRAAMDALQNKALLEKYHRSRMEMDRTESVKNVDKIPSTADGEKKAASTLAGCTLFPIQADPNELLDVNARNQFYAELGKTIGVVPEYQVTSKSVNEHEARLLVTGVLVATAVDTSKKRAMTRAAMSVLNNTAALEMIKSLGHPQV